MAAKHMLDKVRARVERLRKESLDTAAAANKIVYHGVQRIADTELKALNETYRAAMNSLNKARGTGSHRDVVAKQIDILQDTANRVIASAREAVGIVSETREELVRLMRKNAGGVKVTVAQIEKTTHRARKAVDKTSATIKQAVKKTEKRVQAAVKTAGKTPRKAVKPATKRARAKPQSRASAATSQAKRAAHTDAAAPPNNTSGTTV